MALRERRAGFQEIYLRLVGRSLFSWPWASKWYSIWYTILHLAFAHFGDYRGASRRKEPPSMRQQDVAASLPMPMPSLSQESRLMVPMADPVVEKEVSKGSGRLGCRAEQPRPARPHSNTPPNPKAGQSYGQRRSVLTAHAARRFMKKQSSTLQRFASHGLRETIYPGQRCGKITMPRATGSLCTARAQWSQHTAQRGTRDSRPRG